MAFSLLHIRTGKETNLLQTEQNIKFIFLHSTGPHRGGVPTPAAPYSAFQEASILVTTLILIKIFETQSESNTREETSLVKILTEIILSRFRFLFFQVNICFCQTLSPFLLLCNCSSEVSSIIWQKSIIWHAYLGMLLKLDSTAHL